MKSFKKCFGVLFIDFLTLSSITDAIIWTDVTEENDPIPPESNLRRFSDPRSVVSKGGVCDGYDGILKINSGDVSSAAGTSFFTYVINQIIYAERNNLIPWVHFTDKESHVYDTSFHDRDTIRTEGKETSFSALIGTKVTEIRGQYNSPCVNSQNQEMTFPGPLDYKNSQFQQYKIMLETSGVWDDYFEPVSAFRPQHMSAADILSCESKPFVDLNMNQQLGMHYCAPYAVRAWPYHGLPEALRPIEGEPNSLNNWFAQMRGHGIRVVRQYFHPQPWLKELVDIVHLIDKNDPPCLAMHIQYTNKGTDRRKIDVLEFLPFAETFVENGGESIFIATDSMASVIEIEKNWPEEVSRRVKRQKQAFLSDSGEPIFQKITHHVSNREALIDIYSMARCGLFVHGNSALSEATIYVNGNLNRYNVNLEDPEHIDQEGFVQMVQELIPKKLSTNV